MLSCSDEVISVLLPVAIGDPVVDVGKPGLDIVSAQQFRLYVRLESHSANKNSNTNLT